ncbi:putative membrane protein [Litorimonas taeanensis]|uniref:Putative membrane protein n=1 Tax=Litorimonas taeanensis TaxID=568099 RepID=A0A420WK52_9PROT|nr:DUF502 domain-containing protein [Litorimonas taeanensis]RKQ71403.1 putative membrane protein [Litorimonas taeanensis]
MADKPNAKQKTNLRQQGERVKFKFLKFIRNRFLTGVIVALPIIATVWAIRTFIKFIDTSVWTVFPAVINPKTYLGFDVWGLGLVVSLLSLFLLGTLASNIVGTSILKASERLLARVPIVRGVYSFVKQIVVIVAQQREQAFQEVCLIEYPRKGLWAIGFVTTDLQGAPAVALEPGHVCVFVPTTPNPTSGFLLFAKRDEIKILDMTPEEGAKMIISGGMVSSNEEDDTLKPKRKKEKIPPTDELLL